MVLQETANSSLRWIEADNPGKEEITDRTKVFVPWLNLKDCFLKSYIPKIDRYDSQIFVICIPNY
jgi:Mg2+ and Co2+ transporter CorA